MEKANGMWKAIKDFRWDNDRSRYSMKLDYSQ